MSSLTPRLDRLERNLCINGNFDFWQRGVGPLSISNAAVGRLADRFSFRPSATQGTGSMARSTSVPTVAQSGFQSSYSLQVTAPASGGASVSNTTTSIDMRLEGLDYVAIHGRSARISFWVRSSLTGTYYLALCNSDHSREYLASYTVSAANTWEKKTVDIPAMDTSGTWLFDNGIGLAVHWILQTGSSRQSGTTGSWFTKTGDGAPLSGAGQADLWGTASATFQLAQVMIVPGDFSGTNVDIPFVRAGKSVSDELAMCQRYYEKSYDLDVTPGTNTGTGEIDSPSANISGGGVAVSATHSYKVTKRITVTPTFYTQAGTSGQWVSQSAAGATTSRAATIARSGMNGFSVSMTTSDPRFLGHYTADAEL